MNFGASNFGASNFGASKFGASYVSPGFERGGPVSDPPGVSSEILSLSLGVSALGLTPILGVLSAAQNSAQLSLSLGVSALGLTPILGVLSAAQIYL